MLKQTQRHSIFYEPSKFSQTSLGLIFSFIVLLLDLFLTLVVGVVLNIVSFYKYKYYIRQRRIESEERELLSIHNRPTIRREIEQMQSTENTKREIEKNMFYMAFTLSSISVLSRFFFNSSYLFYFLLFFNSFSNGLILIFIGDFRLYPRFYFFHSSFLFI